MQKRPWDLIGRILFTPTNSRFLFGQMKTSGSDEVERAFHFYYRNIYSFGGRGCGMGFPRKAGRKAKSLIRAITQIIESWERLEGIHIEHLGYRECLKQYDSQKVLFFLDPPYFKGVKPQKGKVDLSELSDVLKTLKGKFILTIDEEGSEIFN